MCFIITSLQCGDINKEQNTVRIQMEIKSPHCYGPANRIKWPHCYGPANSETNESTSEQVLK